MGEMVEGLPVTCDHGTRSPVQAHSPQSTLRGFACPALRALYSPSRIQCFQDSEFSFLPKEQESFENHVPVSALVPLWRSPCSKGRQELVPVYVSHLFTEYLVDTVMGYRVTTPPKKKGMLESANPSTSQRSLIWK